MSACVVYILFCGITKTYNWALLAAIGAVLIEGMVLILNKWQCPLTTLARKYGDGKGTVADLFYPKWFAPHVFQFNAVLLVIGLALVAWNYIMQ